uniref:Uncharacterized protein n=1 Tax=Arundo donax TaxID=35708 RepID=A0A0A9G5A6_ARUDO
MPEQINPALCYSLFFICYRLVLVRHGNAKKSPCTSLDWHGNAQKSLCSSLARHGNAKNPLVLVYLGME